MDGGNAVGSARSTALSRSTLTFVRDEMSASDRPSLHRASASWSAAVMLRQVQDALLFAARESDTEYGLLTVRVRIATKRKAHAANPPANPSSLRCRCATPAAVNLLGHSRGRMPDRLIRLAGLKGDAAVAGTPTLVVHDHVGTGVRAQLRRRVTERASRRGAWRRTAAGRRLSDNQTTKASVNCRCP